MIHNMINSIGAAKGGHYVAVRDLEDEIEQLGQQDNYIIALSKLCGVDLHTRNELPLTASWQLRRATPEQCAEAFERVMASL